MPYPPYGLTCGTRMGPLLRDRILLLQFMCTTGALSPGIVLVKGGVEDYETLLEGHDSGPDVS